MHSISDQNNIHKSILLYFGRQLLPLPGGSQPPLISLGVCIFKPQKTMAFPYSKIIFSCASNITSYINKEDKRYM